MSDIQNNRAVEGWSLKDVLVAIPVLSSALALTWELGYSGRIGGSSFGFFSIAEHLIFAIQVLPYALLLTTLVMLVAWFRTALGASSLSVQRTFRFSALGVGATAIVVLGAFYYRSGEFDLPSLLLMIMAIVPSFFADAPTAHFKTMQTAIVGIVWLFVVAMLLGIVTAKFQIKSDRPLSILRIGEKRERSGDGNKSEDHAIRRPRRAVF